MTRHGRSKQPHRKAVVWIVGMALGTLTTLGAGVLLLLEWLNCPTEYNSEGRCFDPGSEIVHHHFADVWLALFAAGLTMTAFSVVAGRSSFAVVRATQRERGQCTELVLARSDLWRRHGILNVVLALGLPVVGLAIAPVFALTGRFGTTSALVSAAMLAAPLMNRQVLRSALAVVSRRPYLTLSSLGIHVDGCIFDFLFVAWTDIEAMSPASASIRDALRTGGFVAISLRVRGGAEGTPRTFSSFQHSVHRNFFQVSGYFRQPPEPVIDAIITSFDVYVKRHEPFLLSDMPD